MTTDDLTRAETAVMFALYDRNWTRTTYLPTHALRSLTTRGLVEISNWAEWARLTDTGNDMFQVSA